VQFAKAAGATVLATASGTGRDYVAGLGADDVIERRTERFEERTKGVDFVLDLVGGETLDRSWQVLAPGGVIVSTAAPDISARVPPGRRGMWFTMKPDRELVQQIAGAVAAGTLRSTVAEVVKLSGLADAIEHNKTGHAPGKIVVDFSR
jgi:NADPH:quinone reductase-like Zn-dependent oxidoreductase